MTILLCWVCGAIGVLFGWAVRYRMEQASADVPGPIQTDVPWREWTSVRGDEDEELSDLYGRPIATLEDWTMSDCGCREWVPGSWSDWWSHSAMVLALLYQRRGRHKSLPEWLLGMAENEEFQRSVMHFLAWADGQGHR